MQRGTIQDWQDGLDKQNVPWERASLTPAPEDAKKIVDGKVLSEELEIQDGKAVKYLAQSPSWRHTWHSGKTRAMPTLGTSVAAGDQLKKKTHFLPGDGVLDVLQTPDSQTKEDGTSKPLTFRPGRDIGVYTEEAATLMAAEILDSLRDLPKDKYQKGVPIGGKKNSGGINKGRDFVNVDGEGPRVYTRYVESVKAEKIDTKKKIILTDSEDVEEKELPYDQMLTACGTYTNSVLLKAGLENKDLYPVVPTNEQSVHFLMKEKFGRNYAVDGKGPIVIYHLDLDENWVKAWEWNEVIAFFLYYGFMVPYASYLCMVSACRNILGQYQSWIRLLYM